jgi:hypothetical protein
MNGCVWGKCDIETIFIFAHDIHGLPFCLYGFGAIIKDLEIVGSIA